MPHVRTSVILERTPGAQPTLEDLMRTIAAIADPVATRVETKDMMKALVYSGPGQRAWEAKPKPLIRDPGDAVIRITTTTICGTDLHIMKGDVPTVTAGRILGHEGIGVIEAVGPLVSTFRKGDRVLVSCVSRVRHMRFVSKGHVFALPNGRMDSRQHDRWYPPPSRGGRSHESSWSGVTEEMFGGHHRRDAVTRIER